MVDGLQVNLVRVQVLMQAIDRVHMIMVKILDQTVVGKAAVKTTGGHHRDFAFKGDKSFQYGSLFTNRLPSCGGFIKGLNFYLTFAVIAKGRGFEDRRHTNFYESGLQISQGVHRGKGGYG